MIAAKRAGQGGIFGEKVANFCLVCFGFDLGSKGSCELTGEFDVGASMAENCMADDQGPAFFGLFQGFLGLS